MNGDFFETHQIPRRNVLIVLIGPSGAGKSTFAKNNIANALIVSTDEIRQELCGDFKDQSKNNETFLLFHERVDNALQVGKVVVADATNLSKHSRKTLVDIAKKNNSFIAYVIINRPNDEKKRTAGWRSDVKINGVGLVDYHEKIFVKEKKKIFDEEYDFLLDLS